MPRKSSYSESNVQTTVSRTFVKFNICAKENRNEGSSFFFYVITWNEKISKTISRRRAVRNIAANSLRQYIGNRYTYYYTMFTYTRVLYNIMLGCQNTSILLIRHTLNSRCSVQHAHAHDLAVEILIKFLFPRNRNTLIMLEQTLLVLYLFGLAGRRLETFLRFICSACVYIVSSHCYMCTIDCDQRNK